MRLKRNDDERDKIENHDKKTFIREINIWVTEKLARFIFVLCC
jgi:hypothetical protein